MVACAQQRRASEAASGDWSMCERRQSGSEAPVIAAQTVARGARLRVVLPPPLEQLPAFLSSLLLLQLLPARRTQCGCCCCALSCCCCSPVTAGAPQVLQLQPKNVKALYRRGVARHQLGQTESAMQDLEAALKLYVPVSRKGNHTLAALSCLTCPTGITRCAPTTGLQQLQLMTPLNSGSCINAGRVAVLLDSDSGSRCSGTGSAGPAFSHLKWRMPAVQGAVDVHVGPHIVCGCCSPLQLHVGLRGAGEERCCGAQAAHQITDGKIGACMY
jgi:hypothetical protein